jgi:hypothetical protein
MDIAARALKDFGDKVSWEGGILPSIEYGLRPEDAPDEIRQLWTELDEKYQEMAPLIAAIEAVLRNAYVEGF